MAASDTVSVSKPSSAADTAKSSTFVFVTLRVKAGRARICPAKSPILQPAASNALRRVNVSVKLPTVIVFHTGTSVADLTRICGMLVEGIFLSLSWFSWFCRTSCAAPALASLRMEDAQGTWRATIRCHPANDTARHNNGLLAKARYNGLTQLRRALTINRTIISMIGPQIEQFLFTRIYCGTLPLD